MKKALSFILPISLLLFVLILTCTKDDKVFNEEDTETFEGSLSGTVVNKNGIGLCGASVTARPCGITTVTDENGKFTLPELSSGNYALSFNFVDYLDTAVTDSILVLLSEDKILEDSMKMVYRYGVIKGCVVDESNNPFINAGVQVEEQVANTKTYSAKGNSLSLG